MCDACILREAKERGREILEKAKQEPSLSSDLVSLRWSSEPPSIIGWYWNRRPDGTTEMAEAMKVYGANGYHVLVTFHRSSPTRYSPSEIPGVWYGPLEPPRANY